MDTLTGIFERLRREVGSFETGRARRDEIYAAVDASAFARACQFLHRELSAPVSIMFATDDRRLDSSFGIWCGFRAAGLHTWVFCRTQVPGDKPTFESISRGIYSATYFEREIKEMFGIDPGGAPDTRRLRLHEEVWPKGYYPLRKDFAYTPDSPFKPGASDANPAYQFVRGEGEGMFEVPVGPVHAGIIGPGHFRFSAAGEPIINLEIRLGFTHRGVEKLFEGKQPREAEAFSECVSGDSSFSHSLAFCRAVEKIRGVHVPPRAQWLRALYLELERLYNHAAGMGGIALDVGFSFPSAHCQMMKEALLRANRELTGSRFLKGINAVGGVRSDIDGDKADSLLSVLEGVERDFKALKRMLSDSVSFMDRVDSTGVLRKKTARDLGVSGLAGRASGIDQDLRRDFPDWPYVQLRFRPALEQAGDVLSRLKVRLSEFEESLRLCRRICVDIPQGEIMAHDAGTETGYALGYSEGWRGPVLYWVRTDASGAVERCKVVDPSFLNWQGLAYCVLGDIIPDFPLCNKSFDLSYSGNDL